ncbi:MAG: hypothetical protein IT393_03690 [Nitrospirae bacterium]|nr:hypothetical protein [Nitrospirota bacterium]
MIRDSVMKIQVECYSGYKGEEMPRRLIIGAQVIGVVKVVDQWLAPDHRYFKVEGDNGKRLVNRTPQNFMLVMMSRSAYCGNSAL